MDIMKFKVTPKIVFTAILGMLTEVSFVGILTAFLFLAALLVFSLIR